MWAVVLDIIALGIGAAAFLDLGIGLASGVLQLANADQSSAPSLFRRCVLSEVGLTVGAIGWFSFAAPL